MAANFAWVTGCNGRKYSRCTDYYGRQNKLFYVHFQTISNNALPQPLHEVFVDMPGYYDPMEVMQKLREVGFHGLITPGPCSQSDRGRTMV